MIGWVRTEAAGPAASWMIRPCLHRFWDSNITTFYSVRDCPRSWGIFRFRCLKNQSLTLPTVMNRCWDVTKCFRSVGKENTNNGKRYTEVDRPPRIVDGVRHSAAVAHFHRYWILVAVDCSWRREIPAEQRVVPRTDHESWSVESHVDIQTPVHCISYNNCHSSGGHYINHDLRICYGIILCKNVWIKIK